MRSLDLQFRILGFCLPFLVASVGYSLPKPPKPQGPNQQAFYDLQRSKIDSQKTADEQDKIRGQAINSIRAILSKNASSNPQAFELLLRLGELYLERHDYVRDLELRKYDEEIAKWSGPDSKQETPKTNHKKSVAQLIKAAASLRKLVQEFPKNPRADLALFTLGKTLARLDNANAVTYFKQLNRQFPKSSLVTDSHMALGEYFFDKHEMDLATSEYKIVIKDRSNPVYPYAVYKLGWSLFNSTPGNELSQEDLWRKSASAFKLVVKISDNPQGEQKHFNLRKLALNDLIMVWADLEDTADAKSYLEKIGEGQMLYILLKRLGDAYRDRGAFDKAIALYDKIQEEDPVSVVIPEIQVSLAICFQSKSDYASIVRTLEAAAKTTKEKSSWYRANSKDGDLVTSARENVRKSLHLYATKMHQSAEKLRKASQADELKNYAQKLYLVYITEFPDTPERPQLQIYLASIYQDQEQWLKAAKTYSGVLRLKAVDAKLTRESATQAVVSIESEMKIHPSPATPTGIIEKPLKFPVLVQTYVDSLTDYLKALPNDKEEARILFIRASTYAQYGQYEEALTDFRTLTEKHPSSTHANQAALAAVSLYVQKMDWEGGIKQIESFLTNLKLATKDTKKSLLASLQLCMFSKGVDEMKKEKFAKSAESFLLYAKKFPEANDADRALTNAATSQFKNGDLAGVLVTNKLIIVDFVKSKFRSQAILDSANVEEALGRFREASDLYNQLQRDYPNHKLAAEVLFNAAVLSEASQDHDKAEYLYGKFIRFYPNNALVTDAYINLAEIQKSTQPGKAIDTLDQLLSKNPSYELQLNTQAEIANLSRKDDSSRASKMFYVLRRTLAKNQTLFVPKARQLTAAFYFEQGEVERVKFLNQKIEDGKGFDRTVQLKQNLLLSAVSKYNLAVEAGAASETIATFYRLGEIHENFAKELMAAQPDTSLKEEDKEAFRTAVEAAGLPLKATATDFYSKAFDQSQASADYTQWTKLAYTKLATLAPSRASDLLVETVNPGFIGHVIEKNTKTAIAH